MENELVASSAEHTADHLVDVLQRWEDFGAVWQVVARGDAGVTVSLCRCDGGEEVERFTSDDLRLLTFLAGRTTNAAQD